MAVPNGWPIFTDLLYHEVLDPLFTYSVARLSDDGSSFSVHPLVHVWALRRQDEKRQRTNKAQAAHLLSATFSLSGDHTVDTPPKQIIIATIFAHVFVFSTHLCPETKTLLLFLLSTISGWMYALYFVLPSILSTISCCRLLVWN